MAQNWSDKVNKKFYALDGSYRANTESVEFASGRRITHLKNSVPTKAFAVSILLDDTKLQEGKTEFEHFLFWWENVILSGSESFYLTDIVSGKGIKEYCLTEPPKWTGQGKKEVTLQIEEA